MRKSQKLTLALSLWALSLAAGLGASAEAATAIQCSLKEGQYSVFIAASASDPMRLEAVFWEWGTIQLNPEDGGPVPTVVDRSVPIAVTATQQNGFTRYSGMGFEMSVRGLFELPQTIPPLACDRGELKASAGFIDDLPALERTVLSDCTYSSL